MDQQGQPSPSINLLHASTAETRTRMSKWHAILSRVWCCGNTIQGRRNLLKVLPLNNLQHVGQDNSIRADHRGKLSPPIKHKTLRRVWTYTMQHRSFIQRYLLGRTIQRHLVRRGVPRYFMGQAVSRHLLDRELQRALHALGTRFQNRQIPSAHPPFGRIIESTLATTASLRRTRYHPHTEFWSVPSQRGRMLRRMKRSARRHSLSDRWGPSIIIETLNKPKAPP